MTQDRHNSFPVLAPAVNVAVVRRVQGKWEVLLLRRSAQESHAGKWGLVAGSREDGESAVETARREVIEETGYTPSQLFATEQLIHFYDVDSDSIWLSPVFVALVEVNREPRLSSENVDWQWLSLVRAVSVVSWRSLVSVLRELHDDLMVYPPGTWTAVEP